MRAADVVIVVSSMDGALPSVVAGLIEAPVVRSSPRTCLNYPSDTTGMCCGTVFFRDAAHRCHINLLLQIAVPTSIGYGAAFGGVAPLLGALTTSSPGVTTVNIDNGFGAGMTAARILQVVWTPCMHSAA